MHVALLMADDSGKAEQEAEKRQACLFERVNKKYTQQITHQKDELIAVEKKKRAALKKCPAVFIQKNWE